MLQRIIVNLGQGTWDKGFPTVIVQLWEQASDAPTQFVGQLPAAPGLLRLYRYWQTYYQALNASLSFRQPASTTLPIDFSIEIKDDDITNVSILEFEQLCQTLRQQFNALLSVTSFINIERQLRTQLSVNSQIELIIEANDVAVRQFPWHLWHFFEDYPRAEIAVGTLEYKKVSILPRPPRTSVRLLSILGDTRGIQVNRDSELLMQLSAIDAHVLTEPTRDELNHQLWSEQGWDILFFAGHSASSATGETGTIKINPSESLAISHLKHGLTRAIKRGLRLAIFNSCDGMGLAREMGDLQIPYLIVMREPVPDQVAQAFLMHFLRAFSSGSSFYLAVREARERLQGLESDFPCASWLPVICQNPTAHTLSWQLLQPESAEPALSDRLTDMDNQSGRRLKNENAVMAAVASGRQPRRRYYRQAMKTIAAVSLLVLFGVMGVRSLGWLQASELKAFDHLLQLQPPRSVDERILIVTVEQADLDYQDSTGMERRAGWSLSDAALTQAIEKLSLHSPISIGLDISHPFSFPPALLSATQKVRFVGACQSGSSTVSPEDSTPPPDVPIEQIGFTDFPIDADDVVRRALVLMATGEPCNTTQSFSLQLAHTYLAQQGMGPIETLANKQRQLGDQVLPRLSPTSGGYELSLDEAKGYQILLNNRYALSESSASQPPRQIVSLREILDGSLDADLEKLVRDRLVIIGTDQPWQDRHATAQVKDASLPAGVMIHAQILSQLLDAALGKQSLIWWWPQWVEHGWILGWAAAGSLLGWFVRSPLRLGGSIVVGLLTLYAVCLGALLCGAWIPLIPCAIALLLSAVTILFFKASTSASLRHPDQNK